MAQQMTLFWGSGSPPCWRVMIALEEKGLQGYDGKLLSFEKKEHKSKEVMDLNPRGQLPTFKLGDIILNESIGACLFLENQYPSQGAKLHLEDAAEQAKMYQRMFEGLTLQQKLSEVIYYDWRVPEGERHDSAVQRNKEVLTAELKLWEQYLKQGPFLAGKSFSLADVIVFPVVAYAMRFGVSQERYPCLAQYYNRLKERPSIEVTWPPHWKEDPQGTDMLKDV